MEWVSYLQCHCYANLKYHKCITKLYLTLLFFSIHSYTMLETFLHEKQCTVDLY